MSETWRRDIPQWHNVQDSSWSGISGLRVTHGIEGRVLSRMPNVEDGASLMLRFPAGWRFVPPAETGTLEMFIVSGSLTAQGRRLGVGGFIAIPSGCHGADIYSVGGAEVLAFWNQFNPGDCYPEGAVYIRDTGPEQWMPVEAPGMPHGAFFKPLRMPFFSEQGFGGPAGNLTLVFSLPHLHTEDGEHHEDTWEEIICIGGDIFFPMRGRGGPGTVINNPAWYEHGPFGAQRGHFTIMQATTPLRINRAHIPNGPEKMREYLDSEPLFGDPLRTDDWKDTPYGR